MSLFPGFDMKCPRDPSHCRLRDPLKDRVFIFLDGTKQDIAEKKESDRVYLAAYRLDAMMHRGLISAKSRGLTLGEFYKEKRQLAGEHALLGRSNHGYVHRCDDIPDDIKVWYFRNLDFLQQQGEKNGYLSVDMLSNIIYNDLANERASLPDGTTETGARLRKNYFREALRRLSPVHDVVEAKNREAFKSYFTRTSDPVASTCKSSASSEKVHLSKSKQAALAGPAPRSIESCNQLLIHGLESGHGLFQFVGAQDAFHHNKRDDWMIIDELLERLKKAREAEANRVLINNRYVISAMEEMPAMGIGHRCYQLTAQDLQNPGVDKRMFITEADLNYRAESLRFREIERANAMMEAHVQQSMLAAGKDSVVDPMVLNHFGKGSNVALICYRQAIKRLDEIREVSQIDDFIAQIVKEVTQNRGGMLLGSTEQLEELQIAVMRQFYERKRTESRQESATASDDNRAQARERPDGDPEKPKKRVRFAV